MSKSKDGFYPPADKDLGLDYADKRVWADGKDVTDQPELWPDYARLKPGERLPRRAHKKRR